MRPVGQGQQLAEALVEAMEAREGANQTFQAAAAAVLVDMPGTAGRVRQINLRGALVLAAGEVVPVGLKMLAAAVSEFWDKGPAAQAGLQRG